MQPQWTTSRGGAAACHSYREEAKTSGAGWRSLGLNNLALKRKKEKEVHQLQHNHKHSGFLLCFVCACDPHILCWWTLCRVLLSAVGQAYLWGILLVKQLHRGHCAPHPNVPPIPDQTPHEAGWNITVINTANVALQLLQFIEVQRWEMNMHLKTMKLASWNLTCRTLFFELPTRKIPTVCRPEQRWRYIFLVPKEQWIIISVCFQRYAVHCLFKLYLLFLKYRIFPGAGSRDPQLWAPVCK